MDRALTQDDIYQENKIIQENILLDIINEVCTDPESNLAPQLVAKVNKIIEDCDIAHHSNLHKLNTANESSSSVLGIVSKSDVELTFDEKSDLNEAIMLKIQTKMPVFIAELDKLRQTIGSGKKSRKNDIKEIEDSLQEKLRTMKTQEDEKVELMMEWLNHRLQEVSLFNSSSYDLLSLKTRILELKSQILHLQILRNVFTETNQSIKAYAEINKDLKHSVKETQEKIKKYNSLINEDFD